MNGPPRKQVLEQLDALRREIAEYHRWLAEYPDICMVLENLCLRVEQPLPGSEQARYRSVSNLRDELRAMRTDGVQEVTPREDDVLRRAALRSGRVVASGVNGIDGPRRGPVADGSQTPNDAAAIPCAKAGSNDGVREGGSDEN